MITDLETVKRTLSRLADSETALSGLYTLCSEHWPAHADLWDEMAKCELAHAESIKKMAGLVTAHPERFSVSRQLNLTAINTFITWIAENSEKVRTGKMALSNILFITRDMEHSILESKYTEYLSSTDPDYTAFLHKIIEETVSHRKKLDDKIIYVKQVK